eukprot:c14763_g1_i1.p1 GENE.c14763_g1_i1~~c14763_g1_i1.p1  ORF type:complete len:1112 (+),score=311.81 c14763_g1_i1:32-3367(+)
MTEFAYVVTAHKSSAVYFSAVGNFTGPDDHNLIHGLSNRINIFELTHEGIRPKLEVPIYGRISAMKLFRLPGEQQDMLLVLTEKLNTLILSYNTARGEIVTRARGSVQEPIGTRRDDELLGIVDPECRVIGFFLYSGLFKLIPISHSLATSSTSSQADSFRLEEAFNVKVEEMVVVDAVFLSSKKQPMVAYIYQNNDKTRHFKLMSVNLKSKTWTLEWEAPCSDSEMKTLIPIPEPYGGFVAIGETTIAYCDREMRRPIVVKPTEFLAVGQIDATRYLLGDYLGNLMLLMLETKQDKVSDLKLESLGTVSCPAAISYLDNHFVFIGSASADSQLIRLLPEKDSGDAIEVVESYPCLGPIADMCLIEEDNEIQIITCSGTNKFGTLRVLRSGIGIEEQALIELSGVKKLFALTSPLQQNNDTATAADESPTHEYLVQSFAQETRVLGFDSDGALEEVLLSGIQGSSHSLLCTNVQHSQVIQITTSAVRLLNEEFALVAAWPNTDSDNDNNNNNNQSGLVDENQSIVAAAANSEQIVVGLGGGNIILLGVSKGNLTQLAAACLEHEVACVDISPTFHNTSEVVAVGMWSDMSVRLYRIPSFELLHKEILGNILPRSVSMASLGDCSYLFCGLGDGHLTQFTMDSSYTLANRKSTALGTQPIQLSSFKLGGVQQVFAAGDRPAAIRSQRNKVVCLNINVQDVTCVCPFNSKLLPDCVAIATDQSLMIGFPHNKQKIHVRSTPVEGPYQLAHSKRRLVAVVSLKLSIHDRDESEDGFVEIFDDRTLEVLAQFKLDQYEIPHCVTFCTFQNDPEEYVVVGTAIPTGEENDERGRCIVLKYADNHLKLIAQRAMEGPVFVVKEFNSNLLATSSTGMEMLELVSHVESKELQSEVQTRCAVYNVTAAIQNHLILTVDLMKGLYLYSYNSDAKKIDLLAQEYSTSWGTSAAFLSNDLYLASDNDFNMYIARKNSDAMSDEDRQALSVVGTFHLGDQINTIVEGALVHPQDRINLRSWVFATVNGSIGLYVSIPEQMFDPLNRLQKQMQLMLPSVGSLSHDDWRAFYNEAKRNPCTGFIDGDLIEMFLELDNKRMAEIASAAEVELDQTLVLLEQLAKLH